MFMPFLIFFVVMRRIYFIIRRDSLQPEIFPLNDYGIIEELDLKSEKVQKYILLQSSLRIF